jgi:DGQHR domain-containing protein
MSKNKSAFSSITLQNKPKVVYLAVIPGKWLLERSTPSWRITDPQKGFQRIVREQRAREIAAAVLDQHRTFPNAIVLASDKREFDFEDGSLLIPNAIKFLVVDGQHRLWAQRFSNFDAPYACLIHMGLTEEEMARLFLEINDTQKRVPSSLRWDLVRLVRPEDDAYAIAAAELVYLLASEQESPLYQRVDLTGEQPEIQLKQASLAPDFKQLLQGKSAFADLEFDAQQRVLLQYFSALKERDRDDWVSPNSLFYRARILRALIRLLPSLVESIKKPIEQIRYIDYIPYINKIDASSLESEKIRAMQGSAGIKAIHDQMYEQIFKKKNK